jgi:hypothetical protein
MASVLHRTTLEFLSSVNSPEYPDPPWLHNPDLSEVVGVPQRYWKLVGDVVSEMTQPEKDAADAVEKTAEVDLVRDEIDLFSFVAALAEVTRKELNILRGKVKPTALPDRTRAQMKQAIRDEAEVLHG